MFKKLSVVICGLGVLLMTAGAATAQTATQKAKAKTENAAKKTGNVIEDSAITTDIKTKLLAEKDVSGTDISVETTKGVVTLTGTVKSAAERNKAVKIAKGTHGVKRVVSKLTVEGAKPKASKKRKK
jgi:hyperosmotically inducible protein